MEKFFLKIDANKKEGEEAVACEVECQITCDGAMAISTIQSLFKHHPQIKEMFEVAILLTDVEIELSDEDEEDDSK